MSCVDICPAKDALQFALSPRSPEATNGDEEGMRQRWLGRKVSGAAVAGVLFLLIAGIIVFGKAMGYWDNPFSESMYEYYVPNAQSINHF